MILLVCPEGFSFSSSSVALLPSYSSSPSPFLSRNAAARGRTCHLALERASSMALLCSSLCCRMTMIDVGVGDDRLEKRVQHLGNVSAEVQSSALCCLLLCCTYIHTPRHIRLRCWLSHTQHYLLFRLSAAPVACRQQRGVPAWIWASAQVSFAGVCRLL